MPQENLQITLGRVSLKDKVQECPESVCTASTDKLAKLLAKARKEKDGIDIKYAKNARSSGVGLGPDRRRCTMFLKNRLNNFIKWIPRFRRLRRVGAR